MNKEIAGKVQICIGASCFSVGGNIDMRIINAYKEIYNQLSEKAKELNSKYNAQISQINIEFLAKEDEK